MKKQLQTKLYKEASLATAGIGAAIGGVGGYALTSKREGESESDFKARRQRNVMIGLGAGGIAGGLGGSKGSGGPKGGSETTGTQSNTPQQTAVSEKPSFRERFSQSFDNRIEQRADAKAAKSNHKKFVAQNEHKLKGVLSDKHLKDSSTAISFLDRKKLRAQGLNVPKGRVNMSDVAAANRFEYDTRRKNTKKVVGRVSFGKDTYKDVDTGFLGKARNLKQTIFG